MCVNVFGMVRCAGDSLMLEVGKNGVVDVGMMLNLRGG